jgi:hypothetical protein
VSYGHTVKHIPKVSRPEYFTVFVRGNFGEDTNQRMERERGNLQERALYASSADIDDNIDSRGYTYIRRTNKM